MFSAKIRPIILIFEDFVHFILAYQNFQKTMDIFFNCTLYF